MIVDDQQKRHAYEQKNIKLFAELFLKNGDHSSQTFLPSHAHINEREQILFRQYPLGKIGKKFHTKESRTFKIDDGVLKQVNKNGEERKLPYPSKISQQHIKTLKSQDEWMHKDHPLRLLLEFEERSLLYIYFKDEKSCNEIRVFLISRIREEHVGTLRKSFSQVYLPELQQTFISLICKQKRQKIPNEKVSENQRKKVLADVRSLFSDKKCVSNLMMNWNQKALYDKEKQSKLSIKVTFQKLLVKRSVEFTKGKLKMWVGNKTHEKVVEINDTEREKELFNVMHYNIADHAHIVDSSIWTLAQLELELFHNDHNDERQIWKSERFYFLDLVKSLHRGKRKSISLFNSRKCLQVFLKVSEISCSLLQPRTSTYEEHEEHEEHEEVTPIDYPILREIIPPHSLEKYSGSLATTHHQRMASAYKQFIEEESIQSISFSNCRKLVDSLCVSALVDKFFANHPFTEYIHVSHRGTFVYQFLVNKSEKFSYFDSEKLGWKFNDRRIIRFLSVMKSFDEIPRINFTQPFYWLCKKCLELAEKESLNRWIEGTFEKSLIGRESLAFFLVLAILKFSSPLLLYQPQKTVLSNTSLLFHYTLKFSEANIYRKFLQMQLNPEALFGQEAVSIFSSLLPTQTFLWALTNFLEERRMQMKSQSKQNIENKHLVSLVSIFLSIVKLLDLHAPHSTYISAQHYLRSLKHFTELCLCQYSLILQQIFIEYMSTCEKILQEPSYCQLSQNLEQYHCSTSISSTDLYMGEILSQIFEEFSCYRPKHEADIRKIFITIDHIKLGIVQSEGLSNSNKSPSLIVSLIQKNTKIYEHELVFSANFIRDGVQWELPLDNICHSIELKLIRLEEISIIFSLKLSSNLHYSFSAQLDPKAIPSNFFIQEFLELKPAAEQIHCDCHAFLQLYIKDSCDTDYIENSIPNSYVNKLLLRDRLTQSGSGETSPVRSSMQQDLLFTSHFFRSFRMTQCNFNLLYGKLGWYGCHYLIPDQRILRIQRIHCKPQSVNPKVSLLPPSSLSQITEVMFYSRCIYGRAILPAVSCNGPTGSKLIVSSLRKNQICRESKVMELQVNQVSYTNCSNLSCYLLGNTCIPERFTEFYCKVSEQLPLLQYLCFRPLEFYVLDDVKIKVKVTTSNSKQGTAHSHTTSNLKTKIMAGTSKYIEVIFSKFNQQSASKFITSYRDLQEYNTPLHHSLLSPDTIPTSMCFTFCDEHIFVDDFLSLLRLNMIRYAVSHKVPVGTRSSDSNIKFSNSCLLPNLELYRFYNLLIQTGIEIDLELEVKELKGGKTFPPCRLKKFKDYGWIGGKWTHVEVLAELIGPSHNVYYIEQKESRKRLYIMKEKVMLTSENKEHLPSFEFTDSEILSVAQCVSQQVRQLP